MSDEYQLRKDIDRVFRDIYRLDNDALDIYKIEEINALFQNYYDRSQSYSKEEIDEIIGGSVDLSKYVKKEDVDLKFSLEDNGTIIIGIDVGDGF